MKIQTPIAAPIYGRVLIVFWVCCKKALLALGAFIIGICLNAKKLKADHDTASSRTERKSNSVGDTSHCDFTRFDRARLEIGVEPRQVG